MWFLVSLAAVLFVAGGWILATRRMVRPIRVRARGVVQGEPPLIVASGPAGATIALHHFPAADLRFVEPVIVCHGMAVNRFSVDPPGEAIPSLVRALAAGGFDTWLLELRGSGSARAPRGLDWSIDEEALEDVPAALDAVRAATGASRVWWVGHSKGGILQYVLHAAGHPSAAQVAGLVAIGSPGFFGQQRRIFRWTTPMGWLLVKSRMGLRFRATAPLLVPAMVVVRSVFGFTDALLRELGTRPLQVLFASMFEDVRPATLAQTLHWVRRSAQLTDRHGRSYDSGLARLDKPMLLVSGARDRLAPPSALAHVAARASSLDIEHLSLSAAGGYSHDYGHGDLVLGQSAAREVFPRVVEWLTARATRLAPVQVAG